MPADNGDAQHDATGRARLRPVPDIEPGDPAGGEPRDDDLPPADATGPATTAVRIEYRTIHGYRRAFRIAGSGPALLLIHGIGDNSSTWNGIIEELAENYTVIAPDLLGHGRSDKPRADYSVAAFANGMRDLLVVLGYTKVTVMGHSLGGGVATQFCYQFPRFAERLILVAAGGVTREVNPLLRLVSMPLAHELIEVVRIPGVLAATRMMTHLIAKTPDIPGLPKSLSPKHILNDSEDMMRVVSDIADPEAYSAFVRTLRAVVDWRGQVVTMLDRSYLAERLPVLMIWGDEDHVIPYSHALLAHSAIPQSELVTFEGSGHFPFHDDPNRFLAVVTAFLAANPPAEFDSTQWRELMSRGSAHAELVGDDDTVEAVLEAIDDERNAT